MKVNRENYRSSLNQLFESPMLEPVFEAWRRELFDAQPEAKTRRIRTSGVWKRSWGSIRQCLGVIERILILERREFT